MSWARAGHCGSGFFDISTPVQQFTSSSSPTTNQLQQSSSLLKPSSSFEATTPVQASSSKSNPAQHLGSSNSSPNPSLRSVSFHSVWVQASATRFSNTEFQSAI
ncbi:unnamed protein product [Cuscuta epithymum]|uniref:Uncharacterized protein n=1 Tax=Cuscuta epithymum TaxID=186058 RepID=A0AAV0ETY0_9ASTE|nr:unnamed protein product [Cuscuta epithymum]